MVLCHFIWTCLPNQKKKKKQKTRRRKTVESPKSIPYPRTLRCLYTSVQLHLSFVFICWCSNVSLSLFFFDFCFSFYCTHFCLSNSAEILIEQTLPFCTKENPNTNGSVLLLFLLAKSRAHGVSESIFGHYSAYSSVPSYSVLVLYITNIFQYELK